MQAEEEIIEMMNGCICCTVRQDLVVVLNKLAQRVKSGALQLDAIVIETTGMADPAPVAQTFFVEQSVSEFARLDGIITLVDAKHIEQHLDEQKAEGAENEAVEQVAFADRIILNKTDLATKEDLVRIEARLRTINQFAPIRRSTQSEVSIDQVLNIRGFCLDKVLEMDPEFLDTEAEHVHDASVGSLSIVVPGEVHMALVDDWVSQILQEKGADIYRMKGVLAIANVSKKYVYQAVHMIFDARFDQQWAAGEVRENKLVFIGKNLDHDELRSGFAECLNSPENAARIEAIERAKFEERLGSAMVGAARRDDTPAMQKLLSAGFQVTWGNVIGQTALHIAAMWGNTLSVKFLIDAGAEVNQQNEGGMTALHSSANGRGEPAKRVEAAKVLITAGADTRSTNNGGLIPMQLLSAEDAAAVPELVQVLTPV